jgi:hypothetical protein
MRVFINKVGKSTYDRTSEKIIDFWIEGILESGKIIHFFDVDPFDLRDFEKEEINCLIFAGVNKLPFQKKTKEDFAHPIFSGKYLGEYEIPNNWKLGSLHLDFMDLFSKYHAIQITEGIILTSPKNAKYLLLNKGDSFKFKVTKLELLAWEPIKGEKTIDPFKYERRFIEKFWNLMESTREKCNKDKELQKELIHEELLDWTYDELSLFYSVVSYFNVVLRTNKKLRAHFGEEINGWSCFLQGIIALGREAFRNVFINFDKLKNSIENGKYAESPKKIVLALQSIHFRVFEEKSGLTKEEAYYKYVRKDIKKLRERIKSILDEEMKILILEHPDGNFDKPLIEFYRKRGVL